MTIQDKYMLIVSDDNEQYHLSVYDLENKKLHHRLKSHRSYITQAIFLSEKNHVATSSWDCSVRVWDISDAQALRRFMVGQAKLICLQEYKNKFILSGGENGNINVWDWRSEIPVHFFQAHNNYVYLVNCTPQHFISCGGDNKVKVWDFIKKEESEMEEEGR